MLVAALGGVGLLGELNELLARLRAERMTRARVAVVVPIKRGKAGLARQLVEEGPAFEIEDIGIERHHVFVGEREVVFFFEGEQAAAAVAALVRESGSAEGRRPLARDPRRTAAPRRGAIRLDADGPVTPS